MLLAVVGPGLLAGLSDDDPAGITTYSILGAKYGYELLWVLALSTAALVVFHELGVRLGIVTGKGLLTLVRERFGGRAAALVPPPSSSPTPARSARSSPGSPPAMDLLAGVSRYISVPIAAFGVSALVLRESFRHIEHFLLGLSSIFVAYVISGVLAHPDWGAAAKGLVVPACPLNRDALLVAVATVGTTLAPWGLAFIQSYAVDKRLHVKDLRYERVDVIVGARADRGDRLLRRRRLRRDPARRGHLHQRRGRRRPGAGAARRKLAATLFGLGFLGAALLAAAIVPLSTAYSVSEAFGRRADLDDTFREARDVLPLLRRGCGGRSRARADPRGAARPDALPLPGAQRGPAARAPALHATTRPRTQSSWAARAGPVGALDHRSRPCRDRGIRSGSRGAFDFLIEDSCRRKRPPR